MTNNAGEENTNSWLKLVVTTDQIMADAVSDFMIGVLGAGIEIGVEDTVKQRVLNGYVEKKNIEKEEIDIRNYSIIYKVIDEVKDAMEGMLSPDIVEEISGNAEIRETYKISKVGTIAGCMVLDGKIFRNSKIRLIRDDVEIYGGDLASLKRFKEDTKEVLSGFECGLQIQNYNDIKIGDQIESYVIVEKKRTLDTV